MDPELFGATLMSTGAGGLIVKFEAYHHTERAAHRHSYSGRAERNAVMFGPARLCLVYRSCGIHWCPISPVTGAPRPCVQARAK